MADIIVAETEIQVIEVLSQGPPGVQGPPGESGGDTGRVTLVCTAGHDLSGHRVVYSDGGFARYATANNAETAFRIVGITTHAAATGTQVQIITAGPIEDVSFNFQTSLPIFLGIDGRLTQIISFSWAFRIVIGYPTGPQSMAVRFGEPTFL